MSDPELEKPSEALLAAANVLLGKGTNQEALAALRDLCIKGVVVNDNLALKLDEC